MPGDADLKEARELFAYDTTEWDPLRKEGAKDMLCVAGRVWEAMDPAGWNLRKEKKRPALNLDELSQYVNQVINGIRKNKRAVKVTAMPPADGRRPRKPLEEEARFRANLIREIEYESNAPREAYTVMFENAVQRGYGFCRIVADYVSERSDQQKLIIAPVFNPDLVTPDADALSPDGSDMTRCWVHEWWPIELYKKRYPRATTTDYSAALSTEASSWIRDRQIQLCERWNVETTLTTLYLLGPVGGDGPIEGVFKDELNRGRIPRGLEVRREREVERKKVTTQLTNGYEWLNEKTTWPGKDIPIVSCYGKVLYLDEGQGAKRVLLSLIRLARDPAMLHAYVASAKAEALGGVTRAAWVGYKGQFRGVENKWQEANHEPVAYLEVNPIVDATNQQVLPLPQKQSWDPQSQGMEIAQESSRRSIQSAVGNNPLPTDAQRQNQKSGKALQKIQDSSDRGSYHFDDHFDGSVARVGVILNDLLEHYYDSARDVTVRKPDDTPEIISINTPDQEGAVMLTPGGQFDVTISTGPSSDSEREVASDLADSLMASDLAPMVADLAVKLKNAGPLGDEIAERLTPPEFRQPKDGEPPTAQQLKQALAEAMKKGQELEQLALQMKQALDTDQAKQAATLEKAKLDGQIQLELQQMRNAATIAVAHIAAQSKGAAINAHAAEEMLALGHAATEADKNRLHESIMGSLSAAQGAESEDQGRQHEAEMAERQQAGAMEMQERKVAGDLAKTEMAGKNQQAVAKMKPKPAARPKGRV